MCGGCKVLVKEMTLLSREEFKKYKSLIPETMQWWWLKSPAISYQHDVYSVDYVNDVCIDGCYDRDGGVRPLCIFSLDSTESTFWCKSEKLIGSKIKYGKYNWTVLNSEYGEIYALCDEVVVKHRFDKDTNIWDNSELKILLETAVLEMITIQRGQ